MPKTKKLYILLGVLAVLTAAVFAVSRYEEKKEEIRTSDEIILSLPTDSVTAVSWTNESGSFAFTLEDGAWVYEADAAFPADTEKIEALLEPFASCGAAFVIENVDDEGLYGLDDPVCTITLTAGDETYTVRLGDYSQMDSQRYASIGDGKVYLLSHDPLDEFSAVLRDVICHDTVPEISEAQEITFTGAENYTIQREEAGKSICADDVYFAGEQPLDTSRVESYLSSLSGLLLTEYVTYNATEEELAAYGLADPALTVSLVYPAPEDGEETESFILHLGQNAAELEEAAENGEYDAVTCYARVGDSGIVYEIAGTRYDTLLRAGVDALRHAEIFTADFTEVTAMEITLDGETYEFALGVPEAGEDAENTETEDGEEETAWLWNGEKIDTASIESALAAVKATEFTDDNTGGTVELRLTLTLDNESFPTLSLAFYRRGGESCLAVVNGESVALVPRSQVVDLAEAVRAITLGTEESS